MKVVLLGHRKYVGKDTVADILCDHAAKVLGPDRYLKLGFADPIKAECFRLFGIFGLKPGDFYDIPENTYLKDVKLPKINKSPRELWISMGQWGRSEFEDLWAYQGATIAQQALKYPKLVIFKDFRFPNERNPFRDLGIETLAIHVCSDRAGILDEADIPLLDYPLWDYTFFNNVPKGPELVAKVISEIWPRIGVSE